MSDSKAPVDTFAAQVRAEQIRTLFGYLPLVLVGTLFAAAVVVLVLFSPELRRLLLFWMMAVILLSIVRCGHYLAFKAKAPSPEQSTAWGWQAVALGLLSGLLWALLPPVIINPSNTVAGPTPQGSKCVLCVCKSDIIWPLGS